jgi:hypothetical protein
MSAVAVIVMLGAGLVLFACAIAPQYANRPECRPTQDPEDWT